MQLGFDITSLLYARGVSRYTSNLLRALAKQPGVSLNLYGSSFRRKAELQSLIKNLKIPSANLSLNHIRLEFFPKLWSAGLNPVNHDYQNWYFSCLGLAFPPQIKMYRWLPRFTILPCCAAKLPIQLFWNDIKLPGRNSKTTSPTLLPSAKQPKKDIVELLGIPPKRVHVVYEALPQEVVVVGNTLTDESTTQELHHLGITKPFFLFVGTTEPRKIWSDWFKPGKPFSQEYELVVAGSTGWDESLENLEGTQPIVLGPVSDQTLSGAL